MKVVNGRRKNSTYTHDGFWLNSSAHSYNVPQVVNVLVEPENMTVIENTTVFGNDSVLPVTGKISFKQIIVRVNLQIAANTADGVLKLRLYLGSKAGTRILGTAEVGAGLTGEQIRYLKLNVVDADDDLWADVFDIVNSSDIGFTAWFEGASGSVSITSFDVSVYVGDDLAQILDSVMVVQVDHEGPVQLNLMVAEGDPSASLWFGILRSPVINLFASICNYMTGDDLLYLSERRSIFSDGALDIRVGADGAVPAYIGAMDIIFEE